jgi:hypothetical protein
MFKKWLGLLVVTSVLLLAVCGYLWRQVGNARKRPELKIVFSGQKLTVPGNIRREIKSFQPVITGFKTKNGRNLVLVEWPDKFGNNQQAQLAVPAGTDWRKLKQEYQKGEQIR